MAFNLSPDPIVYQKAQANIATVYQKTQKNTEKVCVITGEDIVGIMTTGPDIFSGKDPEDTEPVPYVLDGQLQHSLKNLHVLPGQKGTVKYKGGEYGISLDKGGKLTLLDIARNKQYTFGHILIKKVDKSGPGVFKLMKSLGTPIPIDTMKFYAIYGGDCGLCIDIGDLELGLEQSVWNNLFVGQYVLERILEAIKLWENSASINLNNTQTKKAIEGFKKIPPEKGYPPGTPFRDFKIGVMKRFQGGVNYILVIELFFKKDD